MVAVNSLKKHIQNIIYHKINVKTLVLIRVISLLYEWA